MKNIFTVICTSALCAVSFSAYAATLDGQLMSGLVMSKSNDTYPVLIRAQLQSGETCVLGGDGSLVAERLEIVPKTMACMDKRYVYEYSITDITVSDGSSATGIRTQHVPASKNVLEITAGMKEMYSRIGSADGLRYVSDMEAGTWHVERGTRVQVHFSVEPDLTKKVALTQ